MKCVVITGSARGLGLELAKEFRKNDFNIVISDILKEELKKAVILLNEIDSKGKVISVDILNRKYKADIDGVIREIELGCEECERSK